ncbi:ABC transporter ATP-binding protein [Nitratireductor kimnyeongensis]|uniref:ABC transporter ATP-binding protein n=1 Tax=Nitratireductor kimnyeongensis TaxID=430679 RepID=A0ABW0T8T3_9HYPH|nr:MULTISPECIES: dipeptide ABC transporter ATP-binding protein [Nitratireductor]MCC5779054.1 dipeptide ABC transporter ATP-binding protein [Nitratireductor sp. B36]QZZ36171.1 dipeptide ABC transporter ATP-binding protein [Nitratireductor kimnyeongensis]
MSKAPLLSVRDLSKYFTIRSPFRGTTVGTVQAVNRVSFDIGEGETLGLVGESGCGKSTTGRLLLRLIEPDRGEVLFEGRDLLKLDAGELKAIRKSIQIVFQDPFSSLNPRMTVEDIITEPLYVQGGMTRHDMRDRARMLLERVGLNAAHITRYPHEFSGGQRQRIGIARALAADPRFIVCDEAVSALDVSVQAQVINLLQDLQEEFNLSYLFIAHDLSVVRHISDRVAVMYLGEVVEIAGKDALYASPRHPYTKALLEAIPVAHPRLRGKRARLGGEVSSALNPPPGCRFSQRCPFAQDVCRREAPALRELGERHQVACHFAEELQAVAA